MKQTKSKKSMKQFLTLMLAFIMVFTGMGMGSWGVDTAWADEISKATLRLQTKAYDAELGCTEYVYVYTIPDEAIEINVTLDKGINNTIMNGVTYGIRQ